LVSVLTLSNTTPAIAVGAADMAAIASRFTCPKRIASPDSTRKVGSDLVAETVPGRREREDRRAESRARHDARLGVGTTASDGSGNELRRIGHARVGGAEPAKLDVSRVTTRKPRGNDSEVDRIRGNPSLTGLNLAQDWGYATARPRNLREPRDISDFARPGTGWRHRCSD
jgi:hypothetical protein